jgi:DNA-binding protein YbaB
MTDTKQIVEKIIDGCREVKKNPEIHKDVKTLATLVIKDCNEALRKLNEAAEANGEEL